MAEATEERTTGIEQNVDEPRSTRRSSTRTASCPGSTSTTACCSSPRTRSIPLLERAKFLAIYASNLDEFFMVRVAGLHDQVDARIDSRGPDGLSPIETIERIADRVTEQGRRHTRQCEEVAAPGARGRTASAIVDVRGVQQRRAEAGRPRLPRPDLPGADAARRRTRAAVPLHLEPVAEPRRVGARPGLGPRDVRAREGAEGGAPALRRDRRGALHHARVRHRAQPRASCSPAWRSCRTTCSA